MSKYRQALQDAIYRLLMANSSYYTEYKHEKDKEKRKKLMSAITRNKSLILDFQYQIYDDERRQN